MTLNKQYAYLSIQATVVAVVDFNPQLALFCGLIAALLTAACACIIFLLTFPTYIAAVQIYNRELELYSGE